ncbi:MAG: RNA pyrophosphohydrolase [Tistrella sp.]|uniref:RNA pyrophosphohydrolase n=1 Tax=Tistrella mobilis TaxID=171437 RepID=A0A3B9IQ04_9PROT|nr:RNA pyrophosphohydrolase [Tistrella sp.]MAD37848.1 RNA pyrophosphohydrolase [Tistrella sp.]MBA78546.1 RNA pyrophosphohydrolase [Tistrella sp.]HAE49885.1 RNA pyrophosphohydrolase [Tistrella mobilis]|tara:strand:+ start:112 stop:588 length:477 start_codon:yes stop_codon:yes gene_type:complete
MAADPADLPYRPCVGIMLLNPAREVFVGQRIDTTAEAWQMPQGGIDPGESPEVTALRELKEEIGTDKARILAETADWLTYDLPAELIGKVWGGRYRGQRQKWFAMDFLGTDADIDLATEHPEFDRWRWLPAQDLPRMIVPFKRALYEQVLAEFDHLLR